MNVKALHSFSFPRALRVLVAATAGTGVHVAQSAAQQFSVRKPSKSFIAAKSAA
jgi:hypothetical protein